jgi:hypothetical protein
MLSPAPSTSSFARGGERIRTADFYVANVALYQLSYTPGTEDQDSSGVVFDLRRKVGLDGGLQAGLEDGRREVAPGALEDGS